MYFHTRSLCLARQKDYNLNHFSELPLSAFLQEKLAAAQFSVPTPVQAVAIPHALQGTDVLATAQAGTGKTLAFLLPMLEMLLKDRAAMSPVEAKAVGIHALVLVPTRELAIQVATQFNVLRGTKLAPAAAVVGGMSEQTQLQAIRQGARLVVATPGRLEDLLSRRLVKFPGLKMLVLDEADRMLDMGFEPAVRRIAQALPKERQTMCFSATLEASVAQLVKDFMRKPARVAIGSVTKPSDTVTLHAFEVHPDDKPAVLQELLDKNDGRVLVFARTKRGTERLAKRLSQDGFAATMIHGDRSQSQRNAALAGFQQGRYMVLVATDVASRGIHVQDIAHVINYDLPEIAEDFIHRIGRTGRAGKKGTASTFFERSQTREILQLERTLGVKMERKTAASARVAGKPASDHKPMESIDESRARRIAANPPQRAETPTKPRKYGKSAQGKSAHGKNAGRPASGGSFRDKKVVVLPGESRGRDRRDNDRRYA